MDEQRDRFLAKVRLDELIERLWDSGYRVIGPTVRNGAIAFDEVRSVPDLPVGLRDEQEPGRYRLVPGADGEVFGVVNGPGALKPLVFAPTEPLVEMRREGQSVRVAAVEPDAPRVAVLGVRACDLAGLAVQDRIFLYDRHRDTHYAARRAQLFLIAVQCTRSVATCFCTSMGTGPRAERGFDLVLTELDDGFVLTSGSPAGAELLADWPLPPAEPTATAEAERRVAACAASMRRHLDIGDLPRLLYENFNHPQWDDVADRCLSCTNCTMVCPTCFCHSVTDAAELSGATTRRTRQWDSCFSHTHGQIHGKNFRPHVRERYRQWLTHKLASWIDQFGSSGCVGCGRCITWCPVGIDLTAEIAAIRGSARST
ncbi:MAG: 4Fe-4S dicluster domain-containing protein [Candidatus Binatia bacterium]